MEQEKNKYHFELAHLGINCNDNREAQACADVLSELFGWEQKDTPGSIFVSDGFEIMKTQYLGERGHIAVYCDDVKKAVESLQKKGVVFDEQTVSRREDGVMTSIYFGEDIAGFRIHLKLRD